MRIEDKRIIINSATFLRTIAPLLDEVYMNGVGMNSGNKTCATGEMWAEALANCLGDVFWTEF